MTSNNSGDPFPYWINPDAPPLQAWKIYQYDPFLPPSTYPIFPMGVQPKMPKPVKMKIEIGCENVEILGHDQIDGLAFANAKLEKQPDLLYVRFKLAHVGGNKNHDGFHHEDLASAQETPVLKGLNWEHDEPSIGVIYASRFVEEPPEVEAQAEEFVPHVVCEAAIWKLRYPDESRKIVKRHSEGTLRFSMEAYYTGCECSECGQVFAADDHPEGTYCEHLNTRFDEGKASSGAIRYLKGFVFGGAGVVEDPADALAESLALAKDDKREEGSKLADKIELTQAELDAKIDEAREAALKEAAANATSEELSDKLTSTEEELNSIKSELTELKTQLDSSNKERDDAVAELTELKTETELVKLRDERLVALKDAGYELPADEEAYANSVEKILKMDGDTFDFYLESVAVPKADDEAPADEAEAETEVVEEDPAKAARKKVAAAVRAPSKGGVDENKEDETDPVKILAQVLALR